MLEINVDKKPEFDCVDNILQTVALNKNRDYELMFLGYWIFAYSSIKNNPIGNNLVIDYNEREQNIEKYHGIHSQFHLVDGIDDLLSIVNKEISNNMPCAVCVDTFWCPWNDEDYNKKHSERYILAIGIEREKGIIYCIDTMINNQVIPVSIDLFKQSKINLIIFKYKDYNIDDEDWKSILKQSLINKAHLDQIKIFANDIRDNLDFTREVDDFKNPFKSEIFSKVHKFANYRKQYSRALGYIAKRFNVLELIYVSNEMQQIGNMWMITFGMLTKAYVTNDHNLIKRMYDKLMEVADKEENIFAVLNNILARNNNLQLSEVEEKLLSYNDITEAFVTVKEYNGSYNICLCAYISSNNKLKAEEIQNYLSKDLPITMVPTYVIQLEEMPLMADGKINTSKLPSPEYRNQPISSKPINATEENLIEIWKGVLGINRNLGIDDNFFELGGNSLLAKIVVGEIHQKIRKSISIRQIYIYPTVRDLSQHLNIVQESPYDKIKPIEGMQYYPLSSAQRSMFIRIQNNLTTLYNLQTAIGINRCIEIEEIKNIISIIVERHDVFRTSFKLMDNELVQIIHEDVSIDIEYMKISENEINNTLDYFIKPFDVYSAPLFRVGFFTISQNKHILVFDTHHIISDRQSLNIVRIELNKLLNNETLPEKQTQYMDYAVWENNLYNSSIGEKNRKYWTEVYQEEIPILNLFKDYPENEDKKYQAAKFLGELNEDLLLRLDNIAKNNNSTIHSLIFTAYAILLYKYSNQNDLIIGSVTAGRSKLEFQNVVGLFVDMIPIRLKINEDWEFKEFLYYVQDTILNAYNHEKFDYDQILRGLSKDAKKRRYKSGTLFDTFMNFNPDVFTNVDLGNSKLEEINSTDEHESNIGYEGGVNFKIDVYRKEDSLYYCFKFNRQIFKRKTIEMMAQHFNNIVNEIVNNNYIKISSINMLSEEEKKKLIVDFNPKENNQLNETLNLHQLFERQVEKTPNNIALVYNTKELNYEELNNRANQLARLLKKKGIAPEVVVGIMMDSSLEMIISILAILKAGGAYLPINPKYPLERVKYMLRDSDTKLLLVQENYMEVQLDYYEKTNVNDEEIYKEDNTNLPSSTNYKNLAYIIYTSGSTGQPKGVLVEVGNVVSYIMAFLDEFNLESNDCVLQQASFAFDAFVEELFPIIFRGGKVAICNKEELLDTNDLVEFLISNKVSLISCSPLLLNELNHLPLVDSVHTYISGGDVLKSEYISNIVGKAKVYNTYGPTEATVCASYYQVDAKDKYDIPIGKPVNNANIYILNKDRSPTAINVAGEIYISGKGVARGYINKKDLTAEKFQLNPFVTGEVMYKTGDLGQWLSDGNIKFLGRIDDQVQVRGFRIELREIEMVLLNHANINHATVIARGKKDIDKYICAYFIADQRISSETLKEYLADYLPYFMIPSYFVQLDSIPMTINGKIDKENLPQVQINESNKTIIKPSSKIEKLLAKIWGEVLSNNNIGINDNFFDLGGNSLKAIVIISKLNQEINVKIPFGKIFKNPTIKDLANFISAYNKSSFKAIKPVERRTYYLMSSLQKTIYAASTIDCEGTSYNIPLQLELSGHVDYLKIEDAFNKIILRHESLRSTFTVSNGEYLQQVHENLRLNLIIMEISEDEIQDYIKSFLKPFDLSKPPLMRAELLIVSDNKCILLVDIHHIVADGESINIIISELWDLYQEKTLPELPITYKDYAVWQQDFLKSDEFIKLEEFWLNKFADTTPLLNLPLDFERPPLRSFAGDAVKFSTSQRISNGLNQLSRNIGTTLNTVLLAAYYVLLANYTCQDDIVVGMPILGRSHPQLAKIVGMFTNTLPVRCLPKGNLTFREFMKEVNDTLLSCYENQDYPIEQLLDKLQVRKNNNRNVIFDTFYNFRELSHSVEKSSAIEYEYKTYGSKVSKFDMSLKVSYFNNIINIKFEYCTDLFKKDTIEKFGETYLHILDKVINDSELRINEIITIEGKNEIIEIEDIDFNF